MPFDSASWCRRTLAAAAMLLGLGSVGVGSAVLTPTNAAAKGTESLADLADSVVDAVVNISAAQVVGDKSDKGDKVDSNHVGGKSV